ncbi:hypothetical protein MMC27_002558 [Xylographa pallens]|nr:hypothetical protein [Xylographa pallens]
MLCKAIKAVPTRPDTAHKLGLLFPQDAKTPQLVWINCRRAINPHPMEEDYTLESPDIAHLMGPNPDYLDDMLIQHNMLRAFELDHTLRLNYRETFLQDGSKKNRSVSETTTGPVRHDWRGPLLTMRQRDIEQDGNIVYEDVTLSDLRHTVDWFSSYTNQSQYYTRTKVQGVKITCEGDRKVSGNPMPWIAVAVPRDHPVFMQKTPPEISRLVELPVLVKKYPPDRAWKDHRQSYNNVQATFLHVDADPKSQGWGWAPPEWQSYVGSVLVVRQDNKDLTPQQAEVLCDFCYGSMQSKFEASLEGTMTRDKVMGFMTKQRFAKFFKDYQKEQTSFGNHWGSAKPPFDD